MMVRKFGKGKLGKRVVKEGQSRKIKIRGIL